MWMGEDNARGATSHTLCKNYLHGGCKNGGTCGLYHDYQHFGHSAHFGVAAQCGEALSSQAAPDRHKCLRVGVAECQAAPICCDLPDRTAYALSDATCTTQQGAAAAENYCAGPVCCVLADGTSETTTLGACEAQRGRALVDASCALDVCCQTRGGASFADAAACAAIGGVVAADNTCLQPACCETNGVLSRVTPPVCTRGGGARVDEARCDRPACCETSPEVFEVNTALGCPAGEVSMRVCLTLDAAAALRVGNNPLTDPAPAAPAARHQAGCATTAGAPAGFGALGAFALLGLSLAPRRRASSAPRAPRQELVK
jgi:hypothetical protein